MYTIVHIIDNLGLGGAQAMLFEIYYAIQKYYPQYKQVILSNENRPIDRTFVSSSNISYNTARDIKVLRKKALSCKSPIIFYHKLASSRINIIREIRRKNSKVPIIVINHTLYCSRDWNRKGICDIMIAVSDHMKNKLLTWYPLLKHKTIHNAVNYFRYKDIKPAAVNKKQILRTGRINRLVGWKYSDNWIKWCSRVDLPIRMIHEYIGSGPAEQKARLVTRIVKNSKNKVKIFGSIPNFKQKISILKSWDLFLYETNRNEGISVAILEALACGVPVICSNHYGNKELIKKGINGYIFKNKEKAQEILRKLCLDSDRLSRLKKTTKEYFINNLDGKFMAKKYMEVVEKIMN